MEIKFNSIIREFLNNQLLISIITFFIFIIKITLNLKALIEISFIFILAINAVYLINLLFSSSNRITKKSYLLKQSYKEYLENSKKLTKEELEKLFKNEKFINLYNERGSDPTKWSK